MISNPTETRLCHKEIAWLQVVTSATWQTCERCNAEGSCYPVLCRVCTQADETEIAAAVNLGRDTGHPVFKWDKLHKVSRLASDLGRIGSTGARRV